MNSQNKNKIGIIGAGAAGLAAAVTVGSVLRSSKELNCWQIDLIEKKNEPGKKLLATGNGKCNITNKNADDYGLCEKFFSDLGILFAEENAGRIYPYSKQALTVRDTLLAAVADCKVNIFTDVTIEKITNNDDGFLLIDQNNVQHRYDKLILTTGGKAGIQHGSDGSGLKMARELGIPIQPILPALVPMTYGKNPGLELTRLKGVRSFVNLRLKHRGRVIAEEQGELQFTDYGLSGICIFNLSRYLKKIPRDGNKIQDCTVEIDLAPDYSYDEILYLLSQNLKAGLKGIVNDKIVGMLVAAGMDPVKDAAKTAAAIKALFVNISGTKGWKEAQVTSGGIGLDHVHMATMEANHVKGLYLAGEILDYDGPCGGYNLSWAWKTGIAAGHGVIDGIEADD